MLALGLRVGGVGVVVGYVGDGSTNPTKRSEPTGSEPEPEPVRDIPDTLLPKCHTRERAVGARLRASVALWQHKRERIGVGLGGSLRRKSIRRKSRRLGAGCRRR